MPKVYEVRNMKFYVNPREGKHEKPHIHVCKGRRRQNGAKIWLTPIIKLGVTKGAFDAGEIASAMKIAEAMRQEFIEDYEKVHGKYVGRAKKR